MALDRQSIEKKDFPIGRRGYDPEAVDAHLARMAEEVDELKRNSRKRSETLASSASEQVRAIVEAAESSAAEIQRQAEEEARDIRAEAADEAQTARQQATAQARDYVGRVSESTAVMLQRLDAMESELTALIESLRTGSNRLNADLQLLEGNIEDVRGSVAPRARFEREAEPAIEPEPPAPAAVVPAAPAAAEATDAEVGLESVAGAGDADAVGDAAASAGEDETEGARLIALNMALNGTPRDETDRYLSDNFTLRDRAQLLDEVYESVDG